MFGRNAFGRTRRDSEVPPCQKSAIKTDWRASAGRARRVQGDRYGAIALQPRPRLLPLLLPLPRGKYPYPFFHQRAAGPRPLHSTAPADRCACRMRRTISRLTPGQACSTIASVNSPAKPVMAVSTCAVLAPRGERESFAKFAHPSPRAGRVDFTGRVTRCPARRMEWRPTGCLAGKPFCMRGSRHVALRAPFDAASRPMPCGLAATGAASRRFRSPRPSACPIAGRRSCSRHPAPQWGRARCRRPSHADSQIAPRKPERRHRQSGTTAFSAPGFRLAVRLGDVN